MHISFESQTHAHVTLDLHSPHDTITTDGITSLILHHGGNADADWSVSDVRWLDRVTVESDGSVIDRYEYPSDAIAMCEVGAYDGYGYDVIVYDHEDNEIAHTVYTSCCTGVTGPCPIDH